MEDRKTILCVEDEDDLRENIATILDSEGYEVIEAENGQIAFEKFPEVKPDLVLSDVSMPLMDGRQLLDNLNKKYPDQLCETPFLFLTAFGQKEDKLSGIKLGADDYIVKPVDFDVLLSTISAKLDKSTSRKKVAQDKMISLCETVSNLIPKEIQQPLQNIISLASTLKKETYGSLVDRKYVDYAGKIYLAALKLNAQISKALDKDKIIAKAENINNYVAISDIISQVKSGTDAEIIYEISENLPDIAIDLSSFVPLLLGYLQQHQIAETKEMSLSAFQDFAGNLVISISGKTLLPVFSGELEEGIKEINADFTVQDDGNETHHIISLPHYLLKSQEEEKIEE